MKDNIVSREKIIFRTSILGIITNLIIAAVKIIIGTAAGSIAIMSEGINNVTDSASSLLALVGSKLASMKPTKKHPFGFGRIEYLTSLIISFFILYTGFEFLKEAIVRIFHPEEMSISYLMIGIIAASAVIKLILGLYTIRMGKNVKSGALEAVGKEGRNDSFVSVITIIVSLCYLLFHFSLDAYAGIITSAIILRAGFEVLIDTVSLIIGKPSDKELADTLYRTIRKNPYILGAADMMLHNYGPDAYSGSVNIEVDHSKSIGEVYESIHRLQLDIMHTYSVTMVFGIYAVDEDRESLRELRRLIAGFVKGNSHIESYHALYYIKDENKLYCDLVVDYNAGDVGIIDSGFKEMIEQHYPGCDVELVVETEFV